MFLAGILLKLGTYGFIRFSLTFFPTASYFYTPLMMLLSFISIIYISIIALHQDDIKKIIAYSSIAHMNFIVLGIFSLEITAIQGAVLLMLSHGIVSSGAFYCIGILYDRYKSRSLRYYNNIVSIMPIYSYFFFLFMLANISIPLTSNFAGELYTIIGIFYFNKILAIIAISTTIFGSVYSM
jgi:NADH-quinone oxidoreductase subunit M